MTALKISENVMFQQVCRPLLNLLGHLARELSIGRSGNDELHELRALLETLPLTVEEFGLAINRLANAHRYVKAHEIGAAKWELNALRQQLVKQLDRHKPTVRV